MYPSVMHNVFAVKVRNPTTWLMWQSAENDNKGSRIKSPC